MSRIVRFLSLCIVSTPMQSALSQDPETEKVEIHALAIKAVNPSHAPGKILVVPRDPLDQSIANRVAARIGSKSYYRSCGGKVTKCDFAPRGDTLAVGVELRSLDDTSAVVRVLTWGTTSKPFPRGHPTFASSNEVRLMKVKGKWTVVSRFTRWES